MSLEGYKPLDLSSLNINPALLQLHAPVGTDSIAKAILANTTWDMPTASSLDSKGKEVQHKKSFVSRLIDGLSIGNYAVADAALSVLKTHQKDGSDSVIKDILKSAAMAPVGFDKGIVAGLKGAFGNDATANDPTDKNHIGDVYLQATAKGRAALDPNSDMSLDQRKSIIRDAYLSGIPADIIADPLNLVGGAEVKAVKQLFRGKNVPEAAQKAEQISKLAEIENKAPELTAKPNVPALNKPPVEALNNFDPATLDFITSTSKLPTAVDNVAEEGFKTRASMAPPVKYPKAMGKLADPARRRNLAGIMLKDAVTNGSWDIVRSKLANSFPGLALTQTHKYLEHLASNPSFLEGLKRVPKNRVNFVEAMDRVLEHDFKATGRAAQEAIKPPVNVAKASDIIDAIVRRGQDREALAAFEAAPEPHVFDAPSLKTITHVITHYRPQIETGIFPGAKNLEHLQQAIDSGKTVKWTGPKQINMWQTILNRLPYNGPAKFKNALAILKHVEDYFINAGHQPFSASRATESIPLRLSDVIEKIGPEAFVKNADHATTLLRSALAGGEMSSKAKQAAQEVPEIKNAIDQAVEAAKADNALQDANAVKQGVDAASTAITVLINRGQSEARVLHATDLAAKTAQEIARKAGASPTGTKLASSILKNLFMDKNPVETAITRNLINTKTALSTGRLGKFNNVTTVTNAIQHTIDSAAPSTLGRAIGPSNRAIDWLGARFNAAYRNADMRPIYLQEAATARSSIARRAAVWNDAVRQFGKDPQLWDRATKMAQGSYHAPVGSREEQLSKLILQNIENLVGSSGLRAGAALEATVAGRAQLLMKELNDNLRRYGLSHEFTNAAIKDETGAIRDYSEGIDWLNSWETWGIKDPLNFAMRFQNAVENTVREANMFNEIASRWGNVKKIKGQGVAVEHPRLAGFYFNTEHANQIKTFIKNLEEIKKPNSKFMRQLDNVLSKWKASVTIYMPSHHIRNFIGDTYMNWLAGVNTTKPYSLALKVMSSQKNRYDSIETLGKLTSPSAVLEAIKRMEAGEQAGEKGTNIVLTMKNGQRVTNDMLYTAAFQKGLLPGARVLEDITDDATLIERFRPLGGKGQAFFQHAAEYREHAIRLAHFIDVVKKSPKNFAGAVEDGARAVRKWHPDGMDMTPFERQVMRRVFPFYSWTRKALPLMVESLVMAPGKVAVYPKVMGGLSQALTGGYGASDPFPTDQLFPQWIRDKGIGPVLTGSGTLERMLGATDGYTILNPSNPTLDLASTFGSPAKGIGSMLNPALRIPAEELTKTEMSTGAPITNQADYISKQLPLISTLTRLTNVGIGGPTAKFDKQGGPNTTALINLLTAAGVLPTGPYQKQAQFELRDYYKNKGG